jgi:N-acetyl-anhydromuramyl-L-alanine amidase AmpD
MKQVTLNSGYRRRRGPVRFVVVHHSNTASAEDTRDVLRRRGLSTHFEVEKDGEVFQYFDPADVVTYHAGAFNGPSVGVDMTHLHKAPWPDAQVQAGHKLIRDLCERFRLPVMVAPEGVRYRTLQEALASGYTVFRHSNLRNTVCPDGFPLEGVANE